MPHEKTCCAVGSQSILLYNTAAAQPLTFWRQQALPHSAVICIPWQHCHCVVDVVAVLHMQFVSTQYKLEPNLVPHSSSSAFGTRGAVAGCAAFLGCSAERKRRAISAMKGMQGDDP